MDQDKHDDSTDDSESDRSDADSEGEEFTHHEDNAEREAGEDKKSGKLCLDTSRTSELLQKYTEQKVTNTHEKRLGLFAISYMPCS